MQRIIGIDYGDARIGIAVSDLLGMTAQPVTTIHETHPERQMEKVLELVSQYEPATIVVGNPKNMDGSYGERSEITAAFAKRLREKTEIPVVMWDERLSSVSAHRALEEAGISGKKRKGKVDTLAATFILQGYLDHM